MSALSSMYSYLFGGKTTIVNIEDSEDEIESDDSHGDYEVDENAICVICRYVIFLLESLILFTNSLIYLFLLAIGM